MKEIKIDISEDLGQVSGLLHVPENSRALLVLAHGAGAGMRHEFMASLTTALAEEGIGTLRFQFPYMEQGRKRPDRPAVAHLTIRKAVERAEVEQAEVPIFAGGKSFGGRMTAQLAAAGNLPQAKGLIFYGFPLHPAGRPATERAEHLQHVPQPMLFLQGTRDRLAEVDLLQDVLRGLKNAELHLLSGGDHSFRTLKRSGISHEQAVNQLAVWTRQWIDRILDSEFPLRS